MKLISSLLHLMIHSQQAALRDKARGLVLLSLAVGLGLLAMVFAVLAGFWGLATILPAWQAALAIAGAAFVVAWLLRLAGLRMLRRRTYLQSAVAPLADAALSGRQAPSKHGLQSSDSLTLVALALVAGTVVGWKISK